MLELFNKSSNAPCNTDRLEHAKSQAANHTETLSKRDNTMKRNYLIPSLIFAASLTGIAMPTSATAQEACSTYTVVSGDSLGSIAQSAYNTFDYQQIFNANRSDIANPNDIEVGTILQLPCADGSLPNAASAQEVIAAQEAIQQTRAKTSSQFEPPIKFVTANGWAPFVGEQFNGGGMLVRLATTALNRGGNSREYNVNFVDDWGSHLTTLLPIGAFDISIAWYIPNCAKIDLLTEGMKDRCTKLDASLPIYETVVGFYTMPGSEYDGVRNFSDLAGARVCRPEGWFTFDLEEQGLIEPVVTMVMPKSINDCMEMLEAGEVDVASLEIESIAASVNEVGMKTTPSQNPYLTNLLELRFVTHKTNPRGRVYLAMLNRGLTEMRESGEWYAIISDSLAEFNQMTNG